MVYYVYIGRCWFRRRMPPPQAEAHDRFAEKGGLPDEKVRFDHPKWGPRKPWKFGRCWLKNAKKIRKCWQKRTSLAKHDDLPWISWLFTKRWWNKYDKLPVFLWKQNGGVTLKTVCFPLIACSNKTMKLGGALRLIHGIWNEIVLAIMSLPS